MIGTRRAIQEFTRKHPVFVGLFIILFGVDVLDFLENLILEGTPVSEALIRLGIGFVVTVAVLYVGLKLMGDWNARGGDDRPE